MMKIHTTQDLSAFVQQQNSANCVSNKEFRLSQKFRDDRTIYKEPVPDSVSFGGLFGGKKPKIKDAKKIVDNIKKNVGDINKEPNPEKKKWDKFIESRLFNWILSKNQFEPAIQAGAAAIICMLLRPATIMSLPAKGKTKEDNIYAASHSVASGLMGLITAILITIPFKKGGNFVASDLWKTIKPETIQRLYPHLNIESIWENKAAGVRKSYDKWLDKNGNKFVESIHTIQFLPKFKKLADVSQATYEKVLNLDIDWAAQKGKSFNDVILKDGSKLYDKIDMSKLGIVVKEEGFDKAQILLRDFDRGYLEKLINDSKGISEWGNLDIKSVYNKEGKVVDFRKWKDTNGKDWKLDLDTVYVSSPIEEIARKPRISGAKRFDKKQDEYKFITYFNHDAKKEFKSIEDINKYSELGTPVTEDIIDAALRNEGQVKLLTWGPDIITKIPVAALTIALIPWTLKHVFGLEKGKKKQEPVKQEVIADNKSENVNFKGKEKKAGWLTKIIAKYYGKPIMESEKLSKLSDKLNKIPGKLTEHMMTAGSLVTSSMYVNRTLRNKELDPDRKHTLAVNQILCFFIPTFAAYTVNHAIDKSVRKFEHRASNKMQYAKEQAIYEGKKPPKFAESMKHVKGIRILSSIGVFALTYRYITPVIVTPIANWIGEKWNAKRAKNKAVKETVIANNK